jgi:hypothetical protein
LSAYFTPFFSYFYVFLRQKSAQYEPEKATCNA